MEAVSEGKNSATRSLDLINCVFVGGYLDQCVCVCEFMISVWSKEGPSGEPVP